MIIHAFETRGKLTLAVTPDVGVCLDLNTPAGTPAEGEVVDFTGSNKIVAFNEFERSDEYLTGWLYYRGKSIKLVIWRNCPGVLYEINPLAS